MNLCGGIWGFWSDGCRLTGPGWVWGRMGRSWPHGDWIEDDLISQFLPDDHEDSKNHLTKLPKLQSDHEDSKNHLTKLPKLQSDHEDSKKT